MARPILSAVVVVALAGSIYAPSGRAGSPAGFAAAAPSTAAPSASRRATLSPPILGPHQFVPTTAPPPTSIPPTPLPPTSIPPTTVAPTTVPPSAPKDPTIAAPVSATTVVTVNAPKRAVVVRQSPTRPLSKAPPPTSPPTTAVSCASVMANVNEHGLFLPANFVYICPGLGLAGQLTGLGGQGASCPCISNSGATAYGAGPEGPGPYISIRDLVPSMLAYEICNAILGYDSGGNTHDTQSGGTLRPSTAACVANHGL